MLGGSYRFSDRHLAEIVQMKSEPGPSGRMLLRPRPPRNAGTGS